MFSETVANKTGFKVWKSNVCTDYEDSIQEPIEYPCVVVYSIQTENETKDRIYLTYVYLEDFNVG
jgi:hypothetical protein